jgi:phage terminase large subunit-like protein
VSAQLVAGPRVDAWQDYAKATRGDYFAAWCGDELVHGGDFENEPFVLEEWQRALMNEALALRDWRLDDDGELAAWLPYWRTFGAVVPRGNGKSPLIAAMAIDHLFAWLSDPRVFIAASDEKQARLLFEYVCHYLRDPPRETGTATGHCPRRPSLAPQHGPSRSPCHRPTEC